MSLFATTRSGLGSIRAVLLVISFLALLIGLGIYFRDSYGSRRQDYKAKSVLRIGLPRLPTGFTIDEMKTIEDYEVLVRMHLSLTKTDTVGHLYPGAAARWFFSDEGLKLTFILKQNLKFDQFTSMNCQDVQHTFERLKGASGAKANSIFDTVENTECTGDYTFVIHLKRPGPFLLEELNRLEFSILSKDKQLGLGPYKLDLKSVNTDKVRLVLKPGLTHDKSLSKELEFRAVDDFSQSLAMLESGELDLVPVRGHVMKQRRGVISSLRKDRKWLLVLSRKFFKNNPELVACLNNAINRKKLVSEINDIAFSESSTPVEIDEDQASRYFSNVFDLEFSECRSKLGKPIRLLSFDTIAPEIVEVVTAELNRVGLTIGQTVLLPKDLFLKKLDSSIYDVALLSYGASATPVLNTTYLYLKNENFVPSKWVGSSLEVAIERMKKARSEVEAKGHLFSILSIASRAAPLIALFTENERFVIGKCVKVLDLNRFRLEPDDARFVQSGQCHE